uniref:Uncharacterized protein n=1 Tax=Ciona savignyi TaxID=51511 RepID=H2YK06_CIOSA
YSSTNYIPYAKPITIKAKTKCNAENTVFVHNICKSSCQSAWIINKLGRNCRCVLTLTPPFWKCNRRAVYLAPLPRLPSLVYVDQFGRSYR